MARWTDEETKQLESLLAAGFLHKEIAAKIGRSIYSVRKRIEWLHMTSLQNELARQRQLRSRQAKCSKYRAHPNAQVTIADRPTEEMFRERDRRIALPAPAFGDPLPGCSALDQLPPWRVDKLR
jgi:hypothetical protein